MGKRELLVSLASIVCAATVSAQSRQITGTIVSENGEPVVGASIVVVGTKTGTVSDIDGKFSFNNIPVKATQVRISYLGMQVKVATIKPDMKITMYEENNQLGDVLVVAYGTAKKASYAGSASMIKSAEIADRPSTSFENALAGKVAGLQVTSSSGQAGSAPSLQIRGIGSMNAGSSPLYVIDGVPVMSGDVGQMSDYTYSTNNIMNSLNPDDIESVSVLKDAAASSLYGSRAANGVIVITTKHGKTGKPQISLKSSIGFTPSWATGNYEAANTQQQVDMLYTVFHDYKTANGASDADANAYALKQLNRKFNMHGYQFTTDGTGAYENVNIGEYDQSGRGGKYFDWDDAYFRTGVYQTNDVSVSGATDKTNYFTSLSYTKDDGRLWVNSFKRVSGRVNLSQKIGQLVEVGTNVSLTRTSKSGYNDTRSTGSNYFMQTRNLLWDGGRR